MDLLAQVDGEVMTKKFRKGLVVGKFSPLTFGHESLIEYAIVQCEQVLILSYSWPEFPKCDRVERERWLKSRFPQQDIVVIDSPSARTKWAMWMPANHDDELSHRNFCADVLMHGLGTTVDAVFSSENYGEGFAAHLTKRFQEDLGTSFKVEHVMHDPERKNIPISGTAVRADPILMKQYVSSNVYASLMPRLVLLGGESSGKTTLAKTLAHELDTAWVSEYGRDEWTKRDGDLRYEDMLHIAQTQVKSELILARRFGNKLLICDTSPLTTLFYCLTLFQNNAPQELFQLSNRTYDFSIVCAPTIPFEQDGTRRDAEFRQTQHQWYLEQLAFRNIKFKVVDGTLAERIAHVREYVGM